MTSDPTELIAKRGAGRPEFAQEVDRLRFHVAGRVPWDRIDIAWDAAERHFAEKMNLQTAIDAGISAAQEKNE